METARYFVVEKKNDAFILELLLPTSFLKKTKIHVGGNYSGALSSVQSLFTLTPLPVSLFFNPHTHNQDYIEEREQFINSYLLRVSGNPFIIFPMIPETEILLFYKKEITENLFQQPITDVLWERAKFEPKAVLEKLLGQDYCVTLEKNLTPEIIAQLQQNPLIIDIVQKHKDTFVDDKRIAA